MLSIITEIMLNNPVCFAFYTVPVAVFLLLCLGGHWVRKVWYWRTVLVCVSGALVCAVVRLAGAILGLAYSELIDGIAAPVAIAVYALILDASIRRAKY